MLTVVYSGSIFPLKPKELSFQGLLLANSLFFVFNVENATTVHYSKHQMLRTITVGLAR